MARTFEELYKEAKDRVLAETKVSNLSPGTIARALLQVYSSQVAELYSYVDQRLLNAYVSTATGSYLDEIGKLLGVDRQTARFSQGKVRFYIDPELGISFQNVLDLYNDRTGGAATSITIPAGTSVRADTKVYVTTTAVTLQSGVTEGETNALCTLAGSFGNTDPNTIVTVIWDDPSLAILEGIVKVTNDAAVESGKDIQTDEDYRFFVTNAVVAGAKANETAIRLACLSVPGVADVTIEDYAYGIGTFAVYVTSAAPIVTDGTLEAVQAAINTTQAKGIRGVAVSPTLIGVQIQVALSFIPTSLAAERSALTTQGQNAVINYINNLKAGEELVINEIIQRVMEISPLIHDSQVLSLAIGDYNLETGLIDNIDNTISIANQKPGLREKFVTNTTLTEVCVV